MTTTIQQTAKKWKGLQAFGVVLLLLSIPACSAQKSGLTALMLAAGLGCYITGRIGAWWHHA